MVRVKSLSPKSQSKKSKPSSLIINNTSNNFSSSFLRKFYLDYAQHVSTKVNKFDNRNEPNSAICVDLTDDGYLVVAAWNGG